MYRVTEAKTDMILSKLNILLNLYVVLNQFVSFKDRFVETSQMLIYFTKKIQLVNVSRSDGVFELAFDSVNTAFVNGTCPTPLFKMNLQCLNYFKRHSFEM